MELVKNMSDQKKRYYNCIDDDIFSKTIIEDGIVIDYPYSNIGSYDPQPIEHFVSYSHPSITFERYVMSRYGVMVEESRIVWYLYKKRFR